MASGLIIRQGTPTFANSGPDIIWMEVYLSHPSTPTSAYEDQRPPVLSCPGLVVLDFAETRILQSVELPGSSLWPSGPQSRP